MTLQPLYDPRNGVMRVIGFMSGSGTNIRKLLEHQHRMVYQAYEIVALFSDKAESNAPPIAKEFDIPVVVRDIRGFYKKRETPLKDLSLRPQFELAALTSLHGYEAVAAAYGGYMSILSPVLVKSYIGVNVHPADLSIKSLDGKPKYRGGHAVADAIHAGESVLRASTHLMNLEVDCGGVLMISNPIPVNPEMTVEANQDFLKTEGDWKIFPKTLEYIANGRYARDETGTLHFDGKPIPHGIRIDEITG